MFEKLGTMSRGTFLFLLTVSAAAGFVVYRWTEPRYEIACTSRHCAVLNRFTGELRWGGAVVPEEDAEARWNRARAEGWADELVTGESPKKLFYGGTGESVPVPERDMRSPNAWTGEAPPRPDN